MLKHAWNLTCNFGTCAELKHFATALHLPLTLHLQMLISSITHVLLKKKKKKEKYLPARRIIRIVVQCKFQILLSDMQPNSMLFKNCG